MTTYSYNTPLDHSSDAAFRAWGSELSAGLQAAGLVQTADTGQIDWLTVARPAINVSAGYEIYRFNDALQATAPVFIKLEYGTASTATYPNLWITVGTGSNGAGTLTGVTSIRSPVLTNAVIASTTTNYPTNICVMEGFAGLSFKKGSYSQGRGGFFICRSVDASGAPNGDGVTVYFGTNNSGAQPISFLTGIAYATSKAYCMIGMDVTSSLVGGTAQVYKHYTITPRMRPNPFMLTVILTEIGDNTQFQATPVGDVEHNYLCVGNQLGIPSINGALNTHGIAMVWE